MIAEGQANRRVRRLLMT